MYKLFWYFVMFLLVSPIVFGFLSSSGYKKTEDEFLDSARWIDGK